MRKRRLRIHVSYEPNRLAESHLSDAYEKLIPTIKHRTSLGKKGNSLQEREMIQKKLKGNFK